MSGAQIFLILLLSGLIGAGIIAYRNRVSLSAWFQTAFDKYLENKRQTVCNKCDRAALNPIRQRSQP